MNYEINRAFVEILMHTCRVGVNFPLRNQETLTQNGNHIIISGCLVGPLDWTTGEACIADDVQHLM